MNSFVCETLKTTNLTVEIVQDELIESYRMFMYVGCMVSKGCSEMCNQSTNQEMLKDKVDLPKFAMNIEVRCRIKYHFNIHPRRQNGSQSLIINFWHTMYDNSQYAEFVDLLTAGAKP